MADDLPIKEDVFHPGSTTDVVDHHVATARPSAIYNHANVSDPTAQVPGDNVAGPVVL